MQSDIEKFCVVCHGFVRELEGISAFPLHVRGATWYIILLFPIFKLKMFSETLNHATKPFSSGLLLYKSGNLESLGHRKGHGVNYFSGHGVIIIRMLRISHGIYLVIKEFEEIFKSMKLSLLVPVRILEAERGQHF